MSGKKTDYSDYVSGLTSSARRAALAMLSASTEEKNRALEAIAQALEHS